MAAWPTIPANAPRVTPGVVLFRLPTPIPGIKAANLIGRGKRMLVSRVSFVRAYSSHQMSVETKENGTQEGGLGFFTSQGTDEDEMLGPICPGCGVFLQDKNPDLPGYYQERKPRPNSMGEIVDDEEEEVEEAPENVQSEQKNVSGAHDNVYLDEYLAELIKKPKKHKKVSLSQRRRMAMVAADQEEVEVTVCSRCFSLRHHGRVKNENAENLIPDFDFDSLVTTRLIKPVAKDTTVVVMVVDSTDFDGSFPKQAIKSLSKELGKKKYSIHSGTNFPKFVLVGTKIDLLPGQISPYRLDVWIRRRARAGGSPNLSAVHLISAAKDMGVRNLLSSIQELAQPRGNVWVIGAQNAGKSTLINMLAKKSGVKIAKLTEAAVPGTTLGIIRIRGIFPNTGIKMYDTPGLLHPYVLSLRLNKEEQKMTAIRRELSPRSYRLKAGQAVHVGGLMRLDFNQASVETIYVTIWASSNISLHMGKIENAEILRQNNAGFTLQPPVSGDRLSQLGKWVRREIKVVGNSWVQNPIDIAVAGLGWFSVGLKGEANVTLWTYNQIDVTLRDPLVFDRARVLGRSGFSLPCGVSQSVGKKVKSLAEGKRKSSGFEFEEDSDNEGLDEDDMDADNWDDDAPDGEDILDGDHFEEAFNEDLYD